MNAASITNIALELPAEALEAIEALESAGFETWAVGGCVRDRLLERPTEDFDLATAAPWEKTEQVLQKTGFSVHRTGTKHGTVTASRNGTALEITTFRSDGAYSDGRHPDSVAFLDSIEGDLARRDFTMNALAYHPRRGILDRFGGKHDLDHHLIRAVGDPAKRFSEDGLRILRGCRFASQLGFAIESETLQAMESSKSMLLKVSSERITHELDSLLLGDYAHDALMETVDVLTIILPEITACKGFAQHTPYHVYDVWEHIAWTVQNAPSTRLARWAALLHDIGKPGAFFMDGKRGHFYGHGKLSVALGRSILGRLAISPSTAERILALVRIHDRQIEPADRSVRRALADLDGDVELFRELLGLKRADALSQSELAAPRLALIDDLQVILENVLEKNAAFTVRQLAVDGNDILALGVKPGPSVGRLLDAALDEVIDGRLPNDRETLTGFLRKQALGANAAS